MAKPMVDMAAGEIEDLAPTRQRKKSMCARWACLTYESVPSIP